MLTDTNQSDLKNNLEPLLPISNKTKAGLLLNPCSGKVKKHLKKIRAYISKFSVFQICEASSLTEINQTIEYFINQRIELLVIIGGDGTVQAALNCYFSNPQVMVMPKILIVPGGTTNMTAKDIGIKGSPIKSLSRLIMLMKGERREFIVNKAVLKIVQNKRPDVYGMFFGAGVIVNGAKFFQNNIRRSGITGELASFVVVLSFGLKIKKQQLNGILKHKPIG